MADDLPKNTEKRDATLITALCGVDGADPRQIDGLGGGHSLSSKVAIVSPSTKAGVDLDYLFLQMVVGENRLSAGQNCGNILAGVLPFAIESGLITPKHPETSATLCMLNSNKLCEVVVQTPQNAITYQGTAKIDGVLGTAAPVVCSYLDTAGAICGALLPTQQVLDVVAGFEMTAIDNGMPAVLLRASDFGITGYEDCATLDANLTLKQQLEAIRLQIGRKMNLGDVTDKTIPKMILLAPPKNQGSIHTRSFIPHTCHSSMGVLAAASVASACLIKGSVAAPLAKVQAEQAERPTQEIQKQMLSIEHPSGELSVNLEYRFEGADLVVKKAGLLRTARLIAKGMVNVQGLENAQGLPNAQGLDNVQGLDNAQTGAAK